MKQREGLEQTRVRSQHGVVVRSALTAIVTLLIEMAGTRHKPKKKIMDKMSYLLPQDNIKSWIFPEPIDRSVPVSSELYMEPCLK